jgi:hypothetical protein
MSAGLLTQPKLRKKGEFMGTNDREEINKLRAKVRELELTISSQDKLIGILRSMPGCRDVGVTDDTSEEKAPTTKVRGARLPRKPKEPSGGVATNSASGHAEDRQ